MANGIQAEVPARQRLVAAGVQLFMRQGLAATGVKQILDEANATFSSLYHHFPGGKDELAAEVIRTAGAAYQGHVETVWDATGDPVEAVGAIFEVAAAVLEGSGYAEACPIETVALEVATTNERLRLATAGVFSDWISAAETRLSAAGVRAGDSRRLALVLVTLLEGAFVLCQAGRSTEPMKAAGRSAAELVRAAFHVSPRPNTA